MAGKAEAAIERVACLQSEGLLFVSVTSCLCSVQTAEETDETAVQQKRKPRLNQMQNFDFQS